VPTSEVILQPVKFSALQT